MMSWDHVSFPELEAGGARQPFDVAAGGHDVSTSGGGYGDEAAAVAHGGLVGGAGVDLAASCKPKPTDVIAVPQPAKGAGVGASAVGIAGASSGGAQRPSPLALSTPDLTSFMPSPRAMSAYPCSPARSAGSVFAASSRDHSSPSPSRSGVGFPFPSSFLSPPVSTTKHSPTPPSSPQKMSGAEMMRSDGVASAAPINAEHQRMRLGSLARSAPSLSYLGAGLPSNSDKMGAAGGAAAHGGMAQHGLQTFSPPAERWAPPGADGLAVQRASSLDSSARDCARDGVSERAVLVVEDPMNAAILNGSINMEF